MSQRFAKPLVLIWKPCGGEKRHRATLCAQMFRICTISGNNSAARIARASQSDMAPLSQGSLMVQNLRFPRSTVQLGFSLIEVMVVVAIAGLLLALAAPSFTPVIERWRVRSATEALQGSIFTARSAAIKHAGDVVLKKNDTGPNGCVSSGATDFKCGWLIWHDGLLRDGNQSACTPTEQTECTIIEFSPPPNVELTVTGATNGRLYFNRQGRITDDTGAIQNNVTVEVIAKHRVITDNNSRRLCIAGAGRSRVIPGYEAC